MRPASDLDESTILVGTPQTTVTFPSALFPQTYFTFEAGSNFNDCPYCEDYSSEISLELLQSEDFTQFFDNGASSSTEWATRETFVDKVSLFYLLALLLLFVVVVILRWFFFPFIINPNLSHSFPLHFSSILFYSLLVSSQGSWRQELREVL